MRVQTVGKGRREELYTSDSDYETTVTFSLYMGNLDIVLFAPEISDNQIAAISGGPPGNNHVFQATYLQNVARGGKSLTAMVPLTDLGASSRGNVEKLQPGATRLRFFH